MPQPAVKKERKKKEENQEAPALRLSKLMDPPQCVKQIAFSMDQRHKVLASWPRKRQVAAVSSREGVEMQLQARKSK